MKVGDLVKWNHPRKQYQDIGIIRKIRNPHAVYILWTYNPEHSGEYDSDHRLFKLLANGD
jgi:hypothetical protein